MSPGVLILKLPRSFNHCDKNDETQPDPDFSIKVTR